MKENSGRWFGYLFSIAFPTISCAGTELTQKPVREGPYGPLRNQTVTNIGPKSYIPL
jgi:hypothetical protein